MDVQLLNPTIDSIPLYSIFKVKGAVTDGATFLQLPAKSLQLSAILPLVLVNVSYVDGMPELAILEVMLMAPTDILRVSCLASNTLVNTGTVSVASYRRA